MLIVSNYSPFLYKGLLSHLSVALQLNSLGITGTAEGGVGNFRGGSRGGSRVAGGLGVRTPPLFWGGEEPLNFIKREKNVACVRAITPRLST